MVPLLTALDRASFDLQRHGALVLYPSAAARGGTPTILHATTNRFTIRRQRKRTALADAATLGQGGACDTRATIRCQRVSSAHLAVVTCAVHSCLEMPPNNGCWRALLLWTPATTPVSRPIRVQGCTTHFRHAHPFRPSACPATWQVQCQALHKCIRQASRHHVHGRRLHPTVA